MLRKFRSVCPRTSASEIPPFTASAASDAHTSVVGVNAWTWACPCACWCACPSLSSWSSITAILRIWRRARSNRRPLVGSLTRPLAFPLTLRRALPTIEGCLPNPLEREGETGARDCVRAHDGSIRQTQLLGRARLHSDRGPGNVALRRGETTPRAGRARRHAVHPRLRHGPAHVGEPLGQPEQHAEGGDAHPRHALPLGPHPGHPVFLAALRRDERIPLL